MLEGEGPQMRGPMHVQNAKARLALDSHNLDGILKISISLDSPSNPTKTV